MHRPFKTPLGPLVPILGILICGGMIISLDSRTQIAAVAWMVIGLVIYFAYSKSHSRLGKPNAPQPTVTMPLH